MTSETPGPNPTPNKANAKAASDERATLLDLATGSIILAGIALSILGWLVAGVQFSVAVGAGSIVAFGHWWITRRAGEQFLGGIRGGEGVGAGAGRLLFAFIFKLGILALLCVVFFQVLGLSPIGFAMGWGALLLGALFAISLGWIFPTSRATGLG